jgi:hypothetical protein
MHSPRLRLSKPFVIILALLVSAAALLSVRSAHAQDPRSPRLDRPELILEQAGGQTRVWIEAPTPDGGLERSLLRTTEASVTPGTTGFDPARRAAFATWSEAGAQRWFAYSRDAGASWSEAQELETHLALRDGAIEPGQPAPSAPQGYGLPEAGHVYLVQLRTISLPEWRDALAGAGAELLAYFPHNAHLVRLAPESMERLRDLDFVQRVEPYHPWYRIERGLRAWLTADDTMRAKQRVRAMSFGWGAEAKRGIVEAASRLGAEIVKNTPSGHVVELSVTREQLRALAADDTVMWVDRWSEPENDMDLVREDAGTNWLEDNFGYCGQGVRGEVLDSGVQEDHKDFDGILLHGDHDTASHGTSTYGIVFGNGDRDGDGSAKGTGHMPCSEAQGIFADYGFLGDRFAHTEELKQDPYFASFQTNSWGNARTRSYNSYSHEMDDIIWRLDIAILQSQSNAGDPDSRPQAWAKNIISVGGVKHKDTLDTSDDEWDFGASTGPAEDGRIKPDIHYWYDNIYTTTTGDGYTSTFGGTSGATPESAGVLGLMVQMWSENVWETDPLGSTVFERQPHFSTMKALLVNNAQQYPFSGEDDDLTRVHQGWGRPSARVAHERADTSFIVDEEVILEVGDFDIYEVDVPAGESELKVTMVYPDPPGTTSATLHRINNLDLKVTSPSGDVYYGNWGLKEANYSSPGGEPNDVDTVENVFVENPEAGTWEVEVSAPEINQDAHLDTSDDDAVFALVVTGGTSQLAQPSEGRVRMDQETYSCDDRIEIRVIDGNVGASTVPVTIWSDTEPGGESLVLNETGPDAGKYSGEIFTTADPASPDDGLLSVANGDTITVEYIDADDGAGGTDIPRRDEATTDCLKPLISNVDEEGVTDVAATITWDTDELATSEVIWGETTPPTQSEEGFGRTKDHAIDLTDLAECTIYYYEVRSADEFGNLAIDDNGGTYYYFETLGDFGDGLQPCSAGQVTIDEDDYSCADDLTFRVVDIDLNQNPDAAETTTLWATSTTETEAEGVTVTETGPNTSKFTGSIPTAGGSPTADGVLQTSHGDILTVTYKDADDGTGAPATSFDTATADCGGPEISELSADTLTDARFTVRWKTGEPADTVVEWGTTPDLGESSSSSALTTDHAVVLNQFDVCTPVYVRVSSTDEHGNTTTADLSGSPHEVLTYDIPGLYWRDRFEDGASDWSLQGEWEQGAPQGLGGSSGPSDPADAYNNQGVLGHDLSGQGDYGGDYEPGSNEIATSPTLDASSWTNTKLIYHRRLNTHGSDDASLWLWTDAGRPLYRNDGTVSESSFSVQSFDLGAAVDGSPAMRLEFRQSADGAIQYAGWTVDDIILKDGSLPDYAACGDCQQPPSFAGATSAVDNDACGDTGVTVSWNAAFSWGSGAQGTYALYRGDAPGFEPGPSNLVQAGIEGLSFVDESAPTDTTSYYLVRAENAETCSDGPNNGGVTDGGAVYVPVEETLDRPVPGEVGEVDVSLVNEAHVRIEWVAPSDAAEYRVYRSTEPQPETFALLDTTEETFLEDLNSGANANTYFYLVKAANACGEEGP